MGAPGDTPESSGVRKGDRFAVDDLAQYEERSRDRLRAIRQEIADASRRAGRNPDSVRIVAVSKYVDALHAANLSVTWHFIGPVQANKARRIAQAFSLIHSLDRLSLARELDRIGEQTDKVIRSLVQVNVAEDPHKAGVRECDLPLFLQEVSRMTHLRVEGLMTIGREQATDSERRSEFARLRELRDRMESVCGLLLPELSMGMSADYVLAIEEGATLVRIGRKLVLENC
jgi:pyridoxal phosphate enzyme (YggS family)